MSVNRESMNNYIAYQIVRNFVDGLIPRRYRPLVARWLRGDEDVEAKEMAFRKVWDQTPESETVDLAQSLAAFQHSRDAYERRCATLRLRRRVVKYAAGLLLLLASGGALWYSASSYHARSGELLECSVANGATDGLTLSDGTRVRVNAGSTVLYPRKFSRFASNREVYLEGEAHFDVSKDAKQPFIVHVGNLRIRVLYAAGLLLLLASGGALWYSASSYHARSGELLECSVANGATDGLTLSDGTRVRVNAGSTVLYPRKFSRFASNREVYLEGEAHFDVSKDAKQPFIVHVGNLRIRVLGTRFNVKAYACDENVTTTLEEGKVSVSNGRHSALLNPNEQLVYNRISGQMRKTSVDSERYNAWMQGRLVFEQEPLGRVLADVCRKYNIEVVAAPSVDTGRRYTMSFRNDERIDDVMKVITKIAGNLTYQHEHGRIVLKTKKGGAR